MMKIKSLMYVLLGTMLIATACSDVELENGTEGAGLPVNASSLVNVYSDKSGSEESLLAGDVLVKDTRTLMLNVPVSCKKVYMKYNTVSGGEAMKEFSVSPVVRDGKEQAGGFDYATSYMASVDLSLPEDAVQPTSEEDGGYLFYHNTGVVMFEDGWPTPPKSWYDEDFNDVVCEYDLKVTECQSAEQMAVQGSKEELLLTLDIRAIGGMYPTALGVVLEDLDSKYIERITAGLLLKGGQGTMRDLAKEELSADSKVEVRVPEWRWDDDAADIKRNAALTVDKTPEEGTVITLDGLSSLSDDKNDGSQKVFFQVTKGYITEGLPMLRAEIRLIGKEGLTGTEREQQLAAFRELILDTKKQNFFIKANGKEIHMKGYEPTSSYRAEYDKHVAGDGNLQVDAPYSNKDGYTWGIKVPAGTKHVYEKCSFSEAYPGFEEWVNTEGASNPGWYLDCDSEKTVRNW